MKKIEFSKILTISAIFIFAMIGVWSIIEYYQLVQLAIVSDTDILPDATLPVTCIGTILGAILSYCLYQFGLKNSRNKYGIDSEGQQFREKSEYGDFPEQIPVDYIEDNQ